MSFQSHKTLGFVEFRKRKETERSTRFQPQEKAQGNEYGGQVDGQGGFRESEEMPRQDFASESETNNKR